MQKAFDINKVRALSTNTAAGKAVFEILGERERSTKELDLRRLYRSLEKNNIKLSKEEFYDVFKELERLQIGEIILGRKKRPMRFHWSKVKLMDVVEALKDEIVEAKEQHDTKETTEAVKEVSDNFSIKHPDTGFTSNSIVIRKGGAEFEVPVDISNKNLIKLARLIRRIP